MFFASCNARAGENDILVKISGKITNFNSSDNKSLNFSFNDLADIGDHTIKSSNKYVKPPSEYTRPLVRDILSKAGVDSKATTAIISASDGYVVKIPLEDFKKWDVVMAHTVNGVRLTRKTSGPLWNAYPVDKHQELQNDQTYAKMVWNLTKIKIQ